MNANSSVPFYPGKGKVISKPVMQQVHTYKNNIDRRIPTSASHGMISGMNNQMNPNVYAAPPGLEKTIMSQNNLYRGPVEEEAWGPSPYQPDMGYNMGQGKFS